MLELAVSLCQFLLPPRFNGDSDLNSCFADLIYVQTCTGERFVDRIRTHTGTWLVTVGSLSLILQFAMRLCVLRQALPYLYRLKLRKLCFSE